jgi:UDP-N-acetyl-D-mannosaminuronic acid dehydrogenase
MKKTVAVIGTGRVGLPMSLVLADEGYKVYGIDKDLSLINLLHKAQMPFIEEGGEKLLQKHLGKNFFPTTSSKVISDVETIVLTLGTPIDENMNPVLDQIDTVINDLIKYLQRDQLIILRSTVSPRTTKYVADKIDMQTNFKVGKDVFLAFCPERIAEGKAIEEIRELPQIVGADDEISSQKAEEFFKSFGVKTTLPSDSTSAELAKLFTNMYRYITFAISNEFMVIAESFERNIHDIRSLVNTGYKRGGLPTPGLSAGPCLFKDGFFLINENPYLDLITASWKINESTPLFLVKKLREKMELKNKRVALLGLAFKPEIDDIRESLSFKIRKALMREHAEVILHDPYVKMYSRQEVLSDLDNALEDVDAVIIATNHKIYSEEKNKIRNLLKNDTIICDIWNALGNRKLLFPAKDIPID